MPQDGGQPRIVFVDDERVVLDSLRRSLRKMRHKWEMVFFENASEAIKDVEQHQPDMVVTDVRMPGMDGFELLRRVREQCPQAGRFVLSGHFDARLVAKSAILAHQVLTKPCDVNVLTKLLARSIRFRAVLDADRVSAVVGAMDVLPIMHERYAAVLAALENPSSSTAQIADTIQRDISVAGKVLQIAGSAFFGVGSHIDSLRQAVSFLGINVVRAVVTSDCLFEGLTRQIVGRFGLRMLYDHSLRVGLLAGRIDRDIGGRQDSVGAALTAGLLHDIGQLFLAAHCPEAWDQARRIREDARLTWRAAEQEVLGVTHAQVGGCLLARWGFPEAIVESVAFHDAPLDCPVPAPNTLTAVHIADALDLETVAPGEVPGSHLDACFLGERQLPQRISRWRQCRDGMGRGTKEGEQ